jgi:hypothetical protein
MTLDIVRDRVTTTLAAGPTELLGASGIDVKGYSRLSIILVNSGAAPITNISVYWLNSQNLTGGGDWTIPDVGVVIPASAPYGGILSAGQVIEYTITDISRVRMRLAVTGTAGQTVRLSLAATWA